jgi:hypothetical protein
MAGWNGWPVGTLFATRPHQTCATTMQLLKSLFSLSLLESISSSSSFGGFFCRLRFLVGGWVIFLFAVSNSAASTLSRISTVVSMKWPLIAALLPDRRSCLFFKIDSWLFFSLCSIATCTTRCSDVWVRFFAYFHAGVSNSFSFITWELKVTLACLSNVESGDKLVITWKRFCCWFDSIVSAVGQVAGIGIWWRTLEYYNRTNLAPCYTKWILFEVIAFWQALI